MPLRAIAVLFIMAFNSPLSSETLVLFPQRDNAIFFDNPTNSNGAGAFLFAGNTAKNNPRRSLLAFAVADSLPSGSTITAVTLTLQMNRTKAGPIPVALHLLLENWGEAGTDATKEEGAGSPALSGDATWKQAYSDSLAWSEEGGVFAPQASAVATIDQGGSYTWASTDALIADVQTWLEEPASNFGWLLLADEFNAATAKRFASRQHPDETQWPRLRIEYTAVLPLPQPDRAGEVDFDGSGLVDLGDFFLLADQFGQPLSAANSRFDLDDDSSIGLSDFFVFADFFGVAAP